MGAVCNLELAQLQDHLQSYRTDKVGPQVVSLQGSASTVEVTLDDLA